MDSINWLHIRGLALLALLGFFVMYALLAAYWHDWSAKRRARRIAGQRKPLAAEPFAVGRVSPDAKPHAWRDERSAGVLSERAA